MNFSIASRNSCTHTPCSGKQPCHTGSLSCITLSSFVCQLLQDDTRVCIKVLCSWLQCALYTQQHVACQSSLATDETCLLWLVNAPLLAIGMVGSKAAVLCHCQCLLPGVMRELFLPVVVQCRTTCKIILILSDARLAINSSAFIMVMELQHHVV